VSQPTAITALFAEHLQSVSEQWDASLAFAGFDAAIITAGEAVSYFLDDQAPPQKLNPHFLQWCPDPTAIGSALLIRPGRRPQLFFLQPNDYWHQPPAVPEWAETFEVQTFAERDSLLAAARQAAFASANHVALIGDSGQDVLQEISAEDTNTPALLDHLHFARARKTPFELVAMRAATESAVRGHLAAREAFYAGASEFQINLAYLGACGQLPAELPYQNIVALNEHAGVLHYQHYDTAPPADRHSFLIDAGGSHYGYASDITRTYAADSGGLFSELIERMNAAQLALIETMAAGTPYLELHKDMHRRLAGILSDSQLVSCSAEEAFESGLTETFLPHGLGHLIGLQTHDVGGQQLGPEGGLAPPPENYPALRLTRTLEAHMPVTIEPGLYFIPQLLEAAFAGSTGKHLNRDLIESLLPCGGIRIEDNVYLDDGVLVNMTREAFAASAEVAVDA
jgi:Xaa-Pro dipeptidase